MTDWMQPGSSNANVTTNVTTDVTMGSTGQPSKPGGASTSPAIQDIGTRDFGAAVIEASHAQAVLVDFWAPWCGPCKQLGPIIEQAVEATNGAVKLVKMDIDQHPEIAGQMGIQSIPAVVAFIDGRPADAFMGAKSQSEVKAFIDKVLAAKPSAAQEGPDIEAAVTEAGELASNGDHGGAAELYSAILSHEPGNLDALAGLCECYIAVGESERADALLQTVPQEHHSKPPLASVITTIELAKKASELGDIAELAKAVEREPDNHQARFDHAVALNAHGKREAAVKELITIVQKDREWNDDGARTQLVEFFESWGNADPATLSGRRQLSSVLFS